MPKKPTLSARTTLYRVHGIDNLRDAISPRYLSLENFKVEDTAVNNRKALLVKGMTYKDKAPWAPHLSEISGIEINLSNRTASALLLIQDGDNEAWALSYGMGFYLIDRNKLNNGFGMRVAIRTVSPEVIQSLTRTALDTRARTDRSSIPAGAAIRGFGIGDFGEVITRISATAEIEGLAVGDTDTRIRATDSLSLPLGKTPESLTNDLDAIAHALTLNPKPELHALEQLIKVKAKETINRLDNKLRAYLRASNIGSLDDDPTSRLALGWPFERVNEYRTPWSFKLKGTGNPRKVFKDIPELKLLVNTIKNKKPDDPLDAARSVKVILFHDSEGKEHISGDIPVVNWLYFEVETDNSRYCLFDSTWYEMDTEYANLLKNRVREIFERPVPVFLPDWDTVQYPNEAAYNVMAAKQLRGVEAELKGVNLDRCFLSTELHRRGFEACDIFTSQGDFIHVKHINRSAPASHLIAQATVATEAFRYDHQARQKLRELVREAGGQERWVKEELKSVVLGIARKGRFTADRLFSFSQVTLAKLDYSLAASGITLTIVPINRIDKQVS